MHTLQTNGDVTESLATEIIFAAVRGNANFESRECSGWTVEFVKSINDEYLARMIAPNNARTVCAVAFVDQFDL